jgi:lysophospholipase L1-like esterase
MGFERYAALGDSTTEGLDDPYPDGGWRGCADRLAGELATVSPGLHYANLAVRGRRAHEVHAEQLGPALALAPDLATVIAGLNDTLRRDFDLEATAGHVEAMLAALREQGATVVTITFPDPLRVMPISRFGAAERIRALNERLRAGAARTGTLLVDLERHPFASDPRLWSRDRLHANALGHERIAAAIAHALGLPDSSADWSAALPALGPPRRGRAALDEAAWAGRYLVPWLVRRARGRSSGDGIIAKRPDLAPPGPDPRVSPRSARAA